MSEQELNVLILAAGKGTRMKFDLPKVLLEVHGRPMLEYVLDKAARLDAARTVVVVGYQAEKVVSLLGAGVEHVVQEPQLGTGHAVMCAAPLLESSGGSLLVLFGDVPLLAESTVRRLIDTHVRERNVATILTAVLDDPAGYGRIIRDADGRVNRIVEHKDATEEERAVREMNTGICCFRIPELLEVLKEISDDNVQGEYYLTDAIGLMRRRGWQVGAVVAGDPREVEGINTEEQLALAERFLAEISREN